MDPAEGAGVTHRVKTDSAPYYLSTGKQLHLSELFLMRGDWSRKATLLLDVYIRITWKLVKLRMPGPLLGD